MAGPRGYSSYRGRASKLKIALAVLLVLVIFAAAAVIYLQQYVVYDEAGRPVMILPWQGEDEAPPSGAQDPLPEDPVVVIQDPVDPLPEEVTPAAVEITAFSLPQEALTAAGWEAAFAEKPENCNAVAITLKDDTGRIYFDAAGAVSGAVKTEADTAAALAAVTGQEDLYAIARLGCLHDSRAANADVEGRGLKNTGGYIFYDQRNTQWLDASKPGTREYLAGLAQELAVMGFDEILLTGVSYPTEGKLNKVAYGDIPKEDNLAGLVETLHDALSAYEITLSIEMPEAVILTGRDEVCGLELAKIAPWVDRIYAETTSENVEMLAAAVSAASEDTVFVPELAADDPAVIGNKLILAD